MTRIVALSLLLLAGCSKLLGYADGGPRAAEPIRQYPDGADGLKALFDDILEAAKKDDRDRVHALMATLVMSDEQLQSLFGARAPKLLPRYHKLMEVLVNRGAVELVAQVYERKYDSVEVLPVETTGPIINSTPADRAVARVLTHPVPLYAVRFKHGNDTRGMRYDFFFYDGGWKTGNQLGRYLDEKSPDGGT
jgi:hypothetical protein